MGFDDRLGDAQEGGPSHLAGVQQLFHLRQVPLHQPRRDFRPGAGEENLLQLLQKELGGALQGFQHDVSGEAVSHQHVRPAQHGVPGLQVAHKAEPPGLRRLGQQGVGLLAERVALLRLRADVQQGHPGPLHPQDPLGVVVPQVCELEQVLRRTLGIGPAVAQEHPPLRCGKHRPHGRPADSPDALHHQGRPRQQGPGGPGGDEGVPLPSLQQVQPHRQ